MYALLTFAFAASVSAHGFISKVQAGGVSYLGGDPSYQYSNPKPQTPGWFAQNLDNGFISPDAFGTAAIACHKSATPGTTHAKVAAGQTVILTWNTWPDSHKGPVIDYLADCGGDCTKVTGDSLNFVKLDQAGWKSGSNPGTFATDDLIADKFSWDVKIPASLKAGKYVLRHEIIGLHSAGQANGAQAYPQCVNLEVTGSGSTAISGGVKATTFYKATDAGIKFDLYSTFSSYPIPGPAVWNGAKSKVRRLAKAWFWE